MATRSSAPPFAPGLGWIPSRWSSIKIALIYCLVGAAWIYFSGSIAARAVHDLSLLEQVERWKGWLFVVVTTLLLAFSLDRYFARIRLSATRLGESQQELERTNRLYAVLSAVNQAIVRVKTREELFDEVTRALVHPGKFDSAWIGWHNRETQEVELVARAGDPQGLLSQIRVYADDRPEGRGPMGTAIREGRPDICEDFARDPRIEPWRMLAARTPWRSAAAFPIREGGSVRGALCVYAVEPGFFQKREVELLEEAALDVSFALDHLETERRRREAEERLRTATTAGNVGLWDWDLRTNGVYFSPEWKAQIGYAEEEISNDLAEWESRVHPDDLARFQRTIRAFLEKPWDKYQLEFRLRHKDGTYRWIMTQANLLRDEQGRPMRMLGSHVDITLNRRREALLDGQREVLEKIASGAPVAESLRKLLEIVECQSPGMLASILVPDRGASQLRLVAAPSLPESFVNAISTQPLDPESCPCAAAACLREPVLTADMSRQSRWTSHRNTALSHGLKSCWSTPILDDEGALLGTFAIYGREPGLPDEEQLQLLTLATHIAAICLKREQDETALRESERRLRFALEGANEGIWEVHLPTGIFYLSPRGCQLLGYEPEEINGKIRSWHELVHPEDVPAALAALETHLREHTPSFAFEQRLRTKSGEWKWMMCRGRAIEVDAAGQPVRVTGTHADIGERRQMEEALHDLSMRLLQAQDEERRRIARELHDSTAQHLAALTLNLGNLRRLVRGASERAESLCSDNIRLASQAADEVRTLSYLLHPPMLEATGLVGAVEDYAEGFSARTGIAVNVQAPPDFGRLPPETELTLFRIVQESLTNVMRHSGSATARIRFTRLPQQVTLEVQDMGKGIAPDRLARIQAAKGGAGVGLAGMRERLRLVGGHFHVESGPGGTLLRAVAPIKAPDAPGLDLPA